MGEKSMGELLNECLAEARPAVAELGERECREMLVHVVAGVMMGSRLGVADVAQGIPPTKVLEALRAQLEPGRNAPCPGCSVEAPVVRIGSSWCTECKGCGDTTVIGKVAT